MRKLYFFASLLIIACGSPNLIPTTNPVTTESTSGITKVNFAKEENVAKTLKFLASDDNEGRDSGSKGIEKASVFLENLMKENGIKPYFKTYRDTLSNFDKPAYNIVGYIEGNDPKLKNEFVIIGAHYDHIGKIAAVNGDDIANGANDNASGSTAVSEVMKYFAKNKTNKRSLIFTFFSAEEKGLLGSKHLAKKLKAANLDLYVMFNFEMIGVPMQNRDFLLYLTGFGKTNMASKINEYAGEKVIGYVPAETKYQLFRASDNYPFFTEFEVPAQTVSTFDFENFDFYHKPDDEFELMDPKHMTNIVNTMIPVLEIMMNKPTKEITINVK
ncbi:M28 family peptidase [uncultured Flavobacterium sp.]|uniref:M28 family metallopeptidase n=1 Tax=uncultured Flavobacterium sp. TaxID=165435 RepID=UPI0030EE4CD2|tara:strand:- start:64273 stop:65259 length:987 start_codon:yes stop_codon:yes gene_type:complete